MFASERFALTASLPLSLALCAGPAAITHGDWVTYLRASAATFLVLFVLRVVDDVRSLDEDRVAHSERALPAGRIPVAALVHGAALLSAIALVVGIGRLSAVLGLLALYYAGYFLGAPRVPAAAKPVLANLVFFAVPAFTGALQGDIQQHGLLMMGLFFWLSAIGHDFAHSVHAANESSPGLETPAAVLGPRLAAAVGLTYYVGAFLVAVLWFGRGVELPGRPMLFSIGLVTLFAWTGLLLLRLIAAPSRARARPLYISGFACFVIPSLLLGLDHLVGL